MRPLNLTPVALFVRLFVRFKSLSVWVLFVHIQSSIKQKWSQCCCKIKENGVKKKSTNLNRQNMWKKRTENMWAKRGKYISWHVISSCAFMAWYRKRKINLKRFISAIQIQSGSNLKWHLIHRLFAKDRYAWSIKTFNQFTNMRNLCGTDK